MDPQSEIRTNFIRNAIETDLAAGKNDGRVHTRFPPEPNGYLHIGHAKSICINFGNALRYGGKCNLRFDDTNPDKESVEYQEAIKEDVQWLGFDWAERLCHASDYFQALFDYAIDLIKGGKAYVDSQSAEEMRTNRGTLSKGGVDSPYRERSIEENLDLFERMRAGEFEEGSHVLRAKIDMQSGNINMRDPTIYRIRKTAHHRTGDQWPIYPMYDYTHCLSDALEGVTHSLCTLEFEDHRALYDWVLDQLDVPCHPQQIEFARLELNYTITSKRKLALLVSDGHVLGWDDPRMPTLRGLRRRGYPPAAIRDFCERVGVTKKDTVIDVALLETCVREELDRTAPRAMAVLRPLKVVIENFPEEGEVLNAPNHPKDESFGKRSITLTKEIFIERDDFMEEPAKKFRRLAPGKEVRLRYGYAITCREVVKDGQGNVVELRCIYDPQTAGGQTPDGRKIKGIIHWVSAEHGVRASVNLIDRLFNVEDPGGLDDFTTALNPDSLEIIGDAVIEPALNTSDAQVFQFERLGYFAKDTESTRENPIFNRTATLRDTWAKLAQS